MSTARSTSQNFISAAKRFFHYVIKWVAISLIIGICIGIASAVFLRTLSWATDLRENHRWMIALLPLAGLAIGLFYHYYGKEISAGNNLLIDEIYEPKKTIPFRMAPFIYIGTMVTHLFGGSAGREGTAIQMAGSIADQFHKPLRLSVNDRKLLLIAAIAAGFGSVFGTPVAGAVFGIEVILIKRLKYDAIFPAAASVFVADLTTRFLKAAHTQYHIPTLPAISVNSILYTLLAGIIFGICAFTFTKLMHITSGIFKSTINYPPLRPVAGGILIVVAVWLIGNTNYIGLGIPFIVHSFEQQTAWYDFLLKMIFTIVTLSAGFKGGEVTPLFFIGAALGSTLSFFIPLPVALLAGMGFVAVFAGATNTPVACTVMAMELFGIGCGIYVAIACVVSYLLSGNTGIYHTQKIPAFKHHRYIYFKRKDLKEL